MNTHTQSIAEDVRVGALARELRIATKILNRDVADLKVIRYGPAPVWTDYADITLNRGMLPPVTGAESIAVWVGAAMHELGHTLFTPRPGSDLHTRLKSASAAHPGIFKTFNIAEDQRQERAIIARFAPMRGYLTAIVVTLILGEGGNPATAWPLVAGRVWIAADARAEVRNAWRAQFGEHSAARIAALIGEYQTLRDPATKDAHRAARVLVELDRELANAAGEMSGCGAPSSHRGESIETPESDAPTAADADADLIPAEGEGEEGAEGEEDADAEGEGAEGEGEGDADGEGEGGRGRRGRRGRRRRGRGTGRARARARAKRGEGEGEGRARAKRMPTPRARARVAPRARAPRMRAIGSPTPSPTPSPNC